MRNITFIDGQNLNISTNQDGWHVDYKKLRIYLKDKYHSRENYYFIGFYNVDQDFLYKKLFECGFQIIFKEHHVYSTSDKKGNVDSDIIFEIFKNIIDNKKINKILIISGDGDYFKTTRYLAEKNRLEKIIIPSKKSGSNLYRKLGFQYLDFMENIKNQIGYIK